LRTGNLNLTLLDSIVLEDSLPVLITNAPGYQLDYFPIEPSYTFGDNDCTVFGESRGDGINICVASNNSTIVAGYSIISYAYSGWSVCPSVLYTVGNCSTNTTWTHPLQQTTSLNVFKRYSTVVYDRQNLSILSVESISPPEVVKIDPQDLRTIISMSLTPGPDSTSADTEMANALVFQLGFVLRELNELFPDNTASPLTLLRGVLAVPIQFSIEVWQRVNASVAGSDPQNTQFALPDDLEVTASSVQETHRAMASRAFTVYVFMGAVSILVLCYISLFVLVYLPETAVPNTSYFSEIDLCSKSAYPLTQPNNTTIMDYSSVLREAGLENADSRKIARAINGKTIRLVEMDEGRDGEKYLLLVVANSKDLARSELENLQALKPGVIY
jgi:hypothetical protein